MQNIAIFAGGTWNSPEDLHTTNVVMMARAVSPLAVNVPKVSFYDWGVGSDGQKISDPNDGTLMHSATKKTASH